MIELDKSGKLTAALHDHLNQVELLKFQTNLDLRREERDNEEKAPNDGNAKLHRREREIQRFHFSNVLRYFSQ